MGLAELFAPLLGNWTGAEQQEASAWSGASGARAAITFKLDLAGSAVVQEYRQVRTDGQEFLGHGVFLLEPGTSRVLWWLFDSYGYPRARHRRLGRPVAGPDQGDPARCGVPPLHRRRGPAGLPDRDRSRPRRRPDALPGGPLPAGQRALTGHSEAWASRGLRRSRRVPGAVLDSRRVPQLVETVNVGRAEVNPHKRQVGATGFSKHPADGPVQVRAPGPKNVGGRGSGLVGDFIGDRRHHGGDRLGGLRLPARGSRPLGAATWPGRSRTARSGRT